MSMVEMKRKLMQIWTDIRRWLRPLNTYTHEILNIKIIIIKLNSLRLNLPFFSVVSSAIRLLANPSHRRKCLLIYRRCHYLFIFPLLTYCPRYIFFAQDGRRKRGVSEVEVIQNGQFRSVDRYGHLRSEWTIARMTSYIHSTKLLDFF